MRKFEWRDGEISIEYLYGMTLRGFSPGCQPKKGFIEHRDDPSGKYWDILAYDRELSEEELRAYELEEVHNA